MSLPPFRRAKLKKDVPETRRLKRNPQLRLAQKSRRSQPTEQQSRGTRPPGESSGGPRGGAGSSPAERTSGDGVGAAAHLNCPPPPLGAAEPVATGGHQNPLPTPLDRTPPRPDPGSAGKVSPADPPAAADRASRAAAYLGVPRHRPAGARGPRRQGGSRGPEGEGVCGKVRIPVFGARKFPNPALAQARRPLPRPGLGGGGRRGAPGEPAVPVAGPGAGSGRDGAGCGRTHRGSGCGNPRAAAAPGASSPRAAPPDAPPCPGSTGPARRSSPGRRSRPPRP